MNTCFVCEEKYDVKNTIRIFGDMHWVNNQCSAQCHTKYIRVLTYFVEDINEALAFSDGDVSEERVLEIAKEKTFKILEILR